MFVICWLANGFAANPYDVDPFSRASLKEAMRRYKAAHEQREQPCLLITNAVVRDTTGRVTLRDTQASAARGACEDAGIQNPDIRITTCKTTGSPTDGLALSEFVKANLGVRRVTVCACTKESAEYYAVMYRMTARCILEFELRAEFVWPPSARPDTKSRMLYRAMRLATVVAGVSRPTFMAWYNLLNRLYQHRLRGFKTTIS